MLTHICPKLPMCDVNNTKKYYVQKLGFEVIADYGMYLIVNKQNIEIHFFEYKDLDIDTNYGQVYIRCTDIDLWYHRLISDDVTIHPNAPLQNKHWRQREFSILDPDNNLLTFGQSL